MSLKQIYDLSIERWGLGSQILMLVEECNELSVAALHLLRNLKDKGKSLGEFAEEIADVEFLLDEMKYYFKNTKLIAAHRRRKERKVRILLGLEEEKKC